MTRLGAASAAAFAVTLAFTIAAASGSGAPPAAISLESLGEALFFDADLSRDRTQSCATCHDPARAFSDPRRDGAGGAVSVGDDGRSLGARNTPSAAYAAFSPPFRRLADGSYQGGQFWDGRADTLETQAGQPLLNPAEMAMPDKAAVVARLKEKPFYRDAFRALFGEGALDADERAFRALASALAAYERSPALSPFDSKYDRSLRGEYTMTEQEELGRVLFFSTQFTNCHLCHQIARPGAEGEVFTDHRFHNIGVPRNPALGSTAVDRGLRQRAGMTDRRQEGRFKVPSLRNVAVTGPYMHNGVFRDLRTVVLFYNKYNATAPARQLDPETGKPWDPPEVPGTLSRKELEFGPALDDRRIDALVAFLKTLTDRRYEPLLGD